MSPYDPFLSASHPDAVAMPPHAEDVHDHMSDTARLLREVSDMARDIASRLDDRQDALVLDPSGYTHHHVASWRGIEAAALAASDAMCALKTRVMAA